MCDQRYEEGWLASGEVTTIRRKRFGASIGRQAAGHFGATRCKAFVVAVWVGR